MDNFGVAEFSNKIHRREQCLDTLNHSVVDIIHDPNMAFFRRSQLFSSAKSLRPKMKVTGLVAPYGMISLQYKAYACAPVMVDSGLAK
jgi:hypothetical protein